MLLILTLDNTFLPVDMSVLPKVKNGVVSIGSFLHALFGCSSFLEFYAISIAETCLDSLHLLL